MYLPGACTDRSTAACFAPLGRCVSETHLGSKSCYCLQTVPSSRAWHLLQFRLLQCAHNAFSAPCSQPTEQKLAEDGGLGTVLARGRGRRREEQILLSVSRACRAAVQSITLSCLACHSCFLTVPFFPSAFPPSSLSPPEGSF